MRNTSTNINEECTKSHNRTNNSTCFITDLYPSDSGVYWCQSAAGECSHAVSITVTARSVILESPAHPVREGEAVTLRCTSKETSSSSLTADFYKDGLLIGSSSTGNLTIHSISKSDEGLYKCSISGAGESAESRLTVRGHPELLTHFPLPVVESCLPLVFVSLLLMFIWRNHKGEIQTSVVFYTHDTNKCNQGELQRSRCFSFSSVAVYRPAGCTDLNTYAGADLQQETRKQPC
uniref:Ig-like domain-containing protein n=1 Tax=Anabas testudineus TaxID=64144 RepID=A0AAQ6I9Z7_ANATE